MDCEICREEYERGDVVPQASTWRYIDDTDFQVCAECADQIDWADEQKAKDGAQDHADARAEERASFQRERSLDRQENDFLNHHYLGDRT